MSIEVDILGCNSALPTSERYPSAQILSVSGRIFLIDCAEGTQYQLRRMKINFMRISHIFISHLHGDHVFGLIGLISTMSLLNRKAKLEIFADSKLETLMRPQLNFYCEHLTYEIVFHHTQTDSPQILLETKSISVESIPLKHRIPTCGFVFREKAKQPNIRKEAIFKYNLSISQIARIKDGEDITDDAGNIIDRSQLIIEPPIPPSYAYISDTAYLPRIVPLLKGINTLYHESTFGQECIKLAETTFHSTATQAATIARDAEVDQLLIGHYSSRYKKTTCLEDEAKQIFKNTKAVADGMKIVIDNK